MEFFVRIGVDNSISTVMTEKPSIHFFYHHIECESIEIVRFAKKTNQIAVVDEEALCKDKPKMNLIASYIMCRPVFGNVLICKEGERDGEPDIVGFNALEVTAARLAMSKVIEKSGMFERSE